MSNNTLASDETLAKAIAEQLRDLSINAPPAQSASSTSNIQNALDYLNKVKSRFDDRPEVYQEFLGIMGNFHHQRIDATTVTQQINELFKGHPDLIKDFEIFTLGGPSAGAPAQAHRTDGDESIMSNRKLDSTSGTMDAISERLKDVSLDTPPVSSSPRPLSMQDALDYLDKVKFRFTPDRTEVYEGFLRIMGDFRNQRLDTPGVAKRVVTLFDGHPDLITEFDKFLPAGLSARTLAQPPRSDGDEGGNKFRESTNRDATSPGNGQ